MRSTEPDGVAARQANTSPVTNVAVMLTSPRSHPLSTGGAPWWCSSNTYSCSNLSGVREPTVEELAYCAGVMDSDGHLGVHVNWYKVKSGKYADSKQPTYQPRCSVKQLDPEAVELFGELFGGHHYVDGGNVRGSRRPINIWQVHSRASRAVLEALHPYLRIKVPQADLLLELCDLNAAPRRHVFDLPAIEPGEPMLTLAEACERAGRSYAVGVQSVKLQNIPFERVGRRIFVPESYVETWATRGRGAMRHPAVSKRMAEIAEAVKALNSGKRNQEFRTPRRY